MNWYQHLFVSLLCGHAVLFFFHVPWSGPLLAAAALGAWIPDVDHEKTRIFKFSLAVVFALSFSLAYTSTFFASLIGPPFSGAWKWIPAFAFALFLSFSWFFIKPPHRGLMHHPLVGVILGAVLAWVSANVWVGGLFVLAFSSHFFVDQL